MKKILLSLFVTALLSACGTPTQKIAITSSGNPEVQIDNQNVDAVKAKLLERLMIAGFQIDTETASTLAASKEMTGMQESIMRLAISNSYSTPVRAVTTFTFSQNSNGVRIFAKSFATSTMPMGQVRKADMDNANSFNATQDSLNRLKSSFN